MTWIDNELDSVSLVLESEWGVRDVVIDDDFQKPRIARAQHRVMIFQGDPIEPHFDRMVEQVRTFAYTAAGDRYLGSSFGFSSRDEARLSASSTLAGSSPRTRAMARSVRSIR